MHILETESILLTLISAANEQSTSLFRSTCTHTHTTILYVYTLKILGVSVDQPLVSPEAVWMEMSPAKAAV